MEVEMEVIFLSFINSGVGDQLENGGFQCYFSMWGVGFDFDFVFGLFRVYRVQLFIFGVDGRGVVCGVEERIWFCISFGDVVYGFVFREL